MLRGCELGLLNASTRSVLLLPKHTPWASAGLACLPASRLVHAVQQVGILSLHDLAPDLQAGRDLTLLDGELTWQDLEPLDRFPALELFVALPDESLDRLGIEGDQSRGVLAAVAVHQNLADIGAGRLEHTFDLLRSHILGARGLDQVLLPVSD